MGFPVMGKKCKKHFRRIKEMGNPDNLDSGLSISNKGLRYGLMNQNKKGHLRALLNLPV